MCRRAAVCCGCPEDVVEAVNAKKGSPSIRFIQYNVDQTGNGIDASDINAVVNKVMGK